MNSEKIYPLFFKKLKNQTNTQILQIFEGNNISKKEEKIRVIITFKTTIKREDFLLKRKNLEIINKFELIPAINLYLTREKIQIFQENELIQRIEEDQKLYLSMLDAFRMMSFNNYKKSQFSFTGKNITVGIVDNGINKNINSISGVILDEYNLINGPKKEKEAREEGEITHGTLMASIIGNQYLDKNNNFIGIVPDAKIIDFNASSSNQEFFFSNVLQIFDTIIKNKVKIEVLLISFTTLYPSDGKDILSLACNRLVERGIIIICPSGNFGPESYTIGSPSAAEKVITIGSFTKRGTIAFYSGRGPTLDERNKPDFCLPGSEIEIILSSDTRIKLSGTSVAASIGAGIVALIKDINPNFSRDEILEILKEASVDFNYDKVYQGNGIINIARVFNNLGFYQEKTLPYTHLIKNATILSIGLILTLFLLFYLPYILNLIINLYG
ncbi:MAG: S8 family serine peptidase [Promethearchaeota archaeon]